MIIEFQIRTERLLALLRNRLYYRILCLGSTLGENGQSYFIDHLELGESSLVCVPGGKFSINPGFGQPQILDGNIVQLVQPVAIYIVTRAQLEAAGEEPVADAQVGQITIYFNLRVYGGKNDGMPVFCFDYDHVNLGNLGPVAGQFGGAAAIDNLIRGAMPTGCTVLDLDGLEDLLQELAIPNAGIALTTDGRALSIRLEVLKPETTTLPSWQQFLQCQVADRTGNADFVVVIDSRLLVTSIVSRFRTGINALDPSKFAIDEGPDAEWTPDGATPRVSVAMIGRAVDVCPYIVPVLGFPVPAGQKDVGVDLAATIDLTVPGQNQLQINVRLTWELHAFDEFECGINAAVLWPYVGYVLLIEEQIDWGEYTLGWVAGAVAGPTVRIVAAFIAGANQKPPDEFIDYLPGSCEKISESNGEMEVRCAMNINLGDMPLAGPLRVDSMVAAADGPVLSGSLPSVPGVAPPSFTVEVHGFEWSVLGTCDEPFIGAAAVVSIYPGGEAPLVRCSTPASVIIDDPLNQFRPFLQVDGFTFSVVLTLSDLVPEYLELPEKYPLKMLIQTNAGTRLITIPGITEPDDSTKEQLKFVLIAVKVDCKVWQEWWNDDVFKHKWFPDPPPQLQAQHVWQMTVAGLAPRERLTFGDRQGNVLAVTQATQAGVSQFTLMAAPDRFGDKLHVNQTASADQHAAPDAAAARSPSRGSVIRIRHFLLLPEAVVNLSAPCLQLTSAYFAGRPALFCITEGRLHVFDLRTPKLPYLVWHERSPGLRGAIRFHDGFLVWGAAGYRAPRGATFATTAEARRPVRSLRANRTQSIAAAAASAEFVYALTPSAIQVYDSNLQLVGETTFEGGAALAVTGGVLTAASASGVFVFDVHHPATVRQIRKFELPGVQEIVRTSVRDSSNAVFVRNREGRASVIDVSAGRQPQELTRHEEDPWILGAPERGKIFARLNASRTQVTLYRVDQISAPHFIGRLQAQPPV